MTSAYCSVLRAQRELQDQLWHGQQCHFDFDEAARNQMHPCSVRFKRVWLLQLQLDGIYLQCLCLADRSMVAIPTTCIELRMYSHQHP